MIYEYALEPEMVAKWGEAKNYRFFITAFGLGQGRVLSRYPKNWLRKVWTVFESESELEKKRLEELLFRFKENMVKRKEYVWEEARDGWMDNALVEHDRHPFRAILSVKNPNKLTQVICEDNIGIVPCDMWDVPHGITVQRTAEEMASAIEMMLSRCRWVKFIDPYIAKDKSRHKKTLSAFLQILASANPVGHPQEIEFHTSGEGATSEHLRGVWEKIIPTGLTVTLYQWQEKPGGQKLHNRYILTDLGGVSFQHGLDTGAEGETDDITRLDREQYELRCKQYDRASSVFDAAEEPSIINGTKSA